MSSISAQIEEIKKDVKKEVDKITKKAAQQALQDLQEAHQTIIDDFYDQYEPKFYDRNYNLYNSIIVDGLIKVRNGYRARIAATSLTMADVYKDSPDVIYNYMWNQAVRAYPYQHLPYSGGRASFRGFTFMGFTPDATMVNVVNGWGKTAMGILP